MSSSPNNVSLNIFILATGLTISLGILQASSCSMKAGEEERKIVAEQLAKGYTLAEVRCAEEIRNRSNISEGCLEVLRNGELRRGVNLESLKASALIKRP